MVMGSLCRTSVQASAYAYRGHSRQDLPLGDTDAPGHTLKQVKGILPG
jgi:hypothetical protein